MNAQHKLARAVDLASGRILRPELMTDAALTALRGMGFLNPIGNENGKTAAWGTYRRVGDTCPASCPALNNGCYAQKARVAMAQRRARPEHVAAVNAFVMALHRAAGKPVRLHVSGDLGRTWAEAADLVTEYAAAAAAAGGTRANPVAWGYTALPRTAEGQAHLDALADAASLSVGRGVVALSRGLPRGSTIEGATDDPLPCTVGPAYVQQLHVVLDQNGSRRAIRQALAARARHGPCTHDPASWLQGASCANFDQNENEENEP